MSWKMSVWLFAFVILFVGVIDFPAFAEEQPYPDISIREENDGSYVYWGNDMILELEQNRYIRFRATPADENWVGTERKGADLGWAFSDSLAEGFEVLSTNHLNSPETKEFALNILGKKPNFDSEITICIKGIWLPEQAKFKYVYYTSLNCKLEDWYQNSIVAQNYYERNPNNTAPIEVTDYHIEYISATDRNQSINHREPQKYEYFVRSDDGVTWEKFPKIYVPYPTRDGNYITIRENGKRFQPGSYYGFLDRNYGGWLQKLNKSTTHVSLELCWYFFDLHILLQNVVPPRYSQEDFYAEMELEFLPVEASDANQIMDSAQELDWRSLEEYALPLFTRENTFDQLITDIPSEETSNHYLWWASSYDAYRDDTVGYDDNYSVTIKRDTADAMPVAWNTFCWGDPFELNDIQNHKYRMTAMVKTENCSGPVRLGYAYQRGGIFFMETVRITQMVHRSKEKLPGSFRIL